MPQVLERTPVDDLTVHQQFEALIRAAADDPDQLEELSLALARLQSRVQLARARFQSAQ